MSAHAFRQVKASTLISLICILLLLLLLLHLSFTHTHTHTSKTFLFFVHITHSSSSLLRFCPSLRYFFCIVFHYFSLLSLTHTHTHTLSLSLSLTSTHNLFKIQGKIPLPHPETLVRTSPLLSSSGKCYT